jgi:hypothetical protein
MRNLSWLIVALMAAVSAAGLALRESLYRDEAWILNAWFGNDIVTLFVVVPLLVWALVAAGRGSRRGELVWYAMLGYVVYNYAYYLFGARMNELFPAYVALLVLPTVSLAVLLHRADVAGIAQSFSPRLPARGVAVYLGLTGVGLLFAWVAQWAAFVFAGTVPAVGEEAFTLIASLDLTFVVPLCLIAAALLWRRSKWGYVFGTIMCMKGATYTLVLMAGTLTAVLRGVEGVAGEIPVWGLWTLAGAAATAIMLRGVVPQVDASRTGTTTSI